MSIPTIAEICDAVDTYIGEELVTSHELIRSESYDELSEGIQDEQVLQIYPEQILPVSTESGTGMRTLGGYNDGVIHETIIITVRYFARQRSHIGDDMAVLVPGIEAIRNKLKAQTACPPFGLSNVGSFQWGGNLTTFDYGGALYIGWEWSLVFEVF